ncbi:hypothetical protein D9M71_723570 [compost metagenome]
MSRKSRLANTAVLRPEVRGNGLLDAWVLVHPRQPLQEPYGGDGPAIVEVHQVVLEYRYVLACRMAVWLDP